MEQPLFFPPKLQCLFQPKRYKVLYGGRGAGRSWGVARALISLARSKRLRVLCARELQKSIQDSVHKVIGDQIELMGLESEFEVLQTSIIHRQTGSEFIFAGVRHNVASIKSMEGIDICWVEEAAKLTEDSWKVLTPTVRRDAPYGPFGEGSEIWLTFNPDLERDYIYKTLVLNPPPEAVVVHMTYRDNPWFPEVLYRDLLHMKETDPDGYLNVWEGHCRVALTGAVYGKQLRDAMLEGRIGKVRYDSISCVDTFWDLGRGDKTAIWFVQQIAFEYRIVDYYENSGYNLDHYLLELQKRRDSCGYVYGTAWLPHDARAKSLGTKKSIQEQVAKSHVVRIVPKLSVNDGINAARIVFPKCWFDEARCQDGINALRHYHYDPQPQADGEKGEFKENPVHDWSSHGADAFRYMAVGIREPKREAHTTVIEKLKPTIDKLFLFGEGGSNFGTGWMR